MGWDFWTAYERTVLEMVGQREKILKSKCHCRGRAGYRMHRLQQQFGAGRPMTSVSEAFTGLNRGGSRC